MGLQAEHDRVQVQVLARRGPGLGVGRSCWREARRREVLLGFQGSQGIPRLLLAAAAGAGPNLAEAESLQADLHAIVFAAYRPLCNKKAYSAAC